MKVHIGYTATDDIPWELSLLENPLSEQTIYSGIPSLANFHFLTQLLHCLANAHIEIHPTFSPRISTDHQRKILLHCHTLQEIPDA